MTLYKASDIAKEFVQIAAKYGERLSHMKLQKLVYFAHGWHLGLTGKPLLDETIEAWQYGPVIRSLYDEYKRNGSQLLTPHALQNQPQSLPEAVKILIEKIWNLYGHFTAFQLSSLTHEEGSPWYQVTHFYKDLAKLPQGLDVPDEKIAAYFAQQKSIAHE
ncbi:MAG: DUF4065 domain-containing protein [Alphaproteobacteria bacterium]|nr:DUF4065 domain-containing protein [Alphaproteobacteria bacterium]